MHRSAYCSIIHNRDITQRKRNVQDAIGETKGEFNCTNFEKRKKQMRLDRFSVLFLSGKGNRELCVFWGILWVSSIQFDIFTFEGACKRLGCVPTTPPSIHTSPPPPGESSRVHWPLGLAKSPLSPFPRGRSQHTHAIGEKAALAPIETTPTFYGVYALCVHARRKRSQDSTDL